MPLQGGMDRREFLERSALLAAGAALTRAVHPELLAAADQPTALEGRARLGSGDISLANEAIEGVWTTAEGGLRVVRITDRIRGTALEPAPAAFSLRLAASPVAGSVTANTEMLLKISESERAMAG